MALRFITCLMALIFILSGCGNSKQETASTGAVASPSETKVAVTAVVQPEPIVEKTVVPTPSNDWKVLFDDDLTQVNFQTEALIGCPASDRWIAFHGQWETTADGLLKKNNDAEGAILCRVPVAKGAIRIEYEAMSDSPCDLSLFLGTLPGVKPYSSGSVFFGFGMNSNQRSKIELPGGTFAENDAVVIQPGVWHTVVAERSGGNLIMSVDGAEILKTTDDKNGLESPYIGFYSWNSGVYRRIKVSVRDDEALAAFLTPEALARETAFPTDSLSLDEYKTAANIVRVKKIQKPGEPNGILPTQPLAGLFTDHMVLQRDIAIPVWGWTNPNQAVIVRIADQSASVVAGHDGRWMAKLAALPAGGPHVMSVSTGGTNVQLQDVWVGDVWIASGQSNMQMALKDCNDADAEIAAADYPGIRFFQVKNPGLKEPAANVGGKWTLCSPTVAGSFSGVGYFFARTIHKDIGVPVGIIQNAVGGMPAEAYSPWEKLIANESLRADMEALRANSEADLAAIGYNGIATFNRAPAALWNSLVNPLVPYAIKGAIWYQGESNASKAVQYQTLFPLMIDSWREAWGQGEFPFLYVQLANYMQANDEPSDSSWAELREAQTMTLSHPATGMALAIDIGDANDIHPKNKQDVGLRLGLAALKVAYNRDDIVYSGPMFRSLEKEPGSLRIRFDHTGGGLIAKNGDLKEFAVAGDDGVFYWATARIDGETVVVSSDKVAEPVKVRYAWANNPDGCNLYNAEGLPAVPFRADYVEP